MRLGKPHSRTGPTAEDLLDTDVLVWLLYSDADRDKIRADPLYPTLDVATQGRDVFLVDGTDFYGATVFQTVLSLPLVLDELVPKLTAADDSDPTTR